MYHFIYDSSKPFPSQVIGGVDESVVALTEYHNFPPTWKTVEVTPQQWAARLQNLAGWAINETGEVVAFVPSSKGS